MSPVADLLATPSVPGCNPEQERSATWLELFFDLIFVINVAGLTHHLVAHPGLHSLGQVAVLYVTMSFALPVGIWWFYFRLLDRAELRPRVGSGQLLTYLHLPMTFAVVVMAAAVEVSLSGFTAAQPDGDGVGLLAAARHIVGGDAGRSPPWRWAPCCSARCGPRNCSSSPAPCCLRWPPSGPCSRSCTSAEPLASSGLCASCVALS